MLISTQLEEWHGSPVICVVRRADYGRLPASAFNDAPATLTSRQAVFYRNLIRIAEATGLQDIPVDFEDATGQRHYLDRGCIKIAEHAGFIKQLRNGPNGVVDTIRLSWTV
jgi:hypothetical protein